MAEDVPSLPLFQRLALLVRNERLQGPQVNRADTRHGTSKTWRIETDETAPETTATASPVAERERLEQGPVTVTLAATDDDSGVKKISYSAQRSADGRRRRCGKSGDGHRLRARHHHAHVLRTELSGNVEPVKTLTIRIDKAKPASRAPLFRPGSGRRTASSSASGSCLPSPTASPGRTGSSSIGARATNLVPATSRASTWGHRTPVGSCGPSARRKGDGRVYTFTYEGADRAGNIATCSAQVEVPRKR